MTYTLGGIPISEGTLSIPRVGRPIFVGSLADSTGPAKRTQANLVLGDQTWIGTAQWAAQEVRGWWSVRWVGGMNGIGAGYKGKFYRDVKTNVFLQSFIESIGEQYGGSDINNDAYMKRILIMPGTGAEQLEQALTALTAQVWRIKQDGKLYVIRETFPTITTQSQRVAYDPSIRLLILEEDFAIQPGTVLSGYANIERVTHQISGKKLRTEVHFGPG